MEAIADACRLLGDATRLRMLRVLGRAELNVSELTAILGISQSGVSRHLRMLKEAGLVRERREGSWTYVSAAQDPEGVSGELWALAGKLVPQGADPTGDLARLEEELRLRRERAQSPFWSGDQLPVPGRSWVAWARTLTHVLRGAVVLDVGCGDGGLAVEMARGGAEVIAIDRSPTMLERARRAAGALPIRFEIGELEELPLDANSVDVCLLSQILHHAAEPERALIEAARVVRPTGKLLVTELAPHQEEWVRERLGDQWLGFSRPQLAALLGTAGWCDVHLDHAPKQPGERFEVLIASATKPGATL